MKYSRDYIVSRRFILSILQIGPKLALITFVHDYSGKIEKKIIGTQLEDFIWQLLQIDCR